MKKAFIIPMIIALLVATMAGGVACAEKEFTLSEITFCSKEPAGEGDYEVQPNATYEVGDTIWMYLEVSGFENEKLDGEYEFYVNLALTVLDANDNIMDYWATFDEAHETDSEVTDLIWWSLGIYGTEVYDPGKYTISIDAKDKISGETKNVKGDFSLE